MFKKNIRYLRKKHQLSQQDLANNFGYKSFTTIQKWEDGTSIPSYDVLEKIAKHYNVSVSELMHKDLTTTKVRIPVLGVVHGGKPILAEQQIIDYEEVEHNNIESSEEYFYLEVIGDSMKDARIMPGDRIFVHRQAYLNNNDIGVVMIDDEATVKYVTFTKDKMILMPANSAYESIEIDQSLIINERVKIIGKVIHNKINY